ncbi:hypothetical protein C8J56DRAFT_174356 [Mycena floridula]|nr:hypothetical protein C8J56DRAFT_174356 [Mycena floridula]
MSSSRSPVATSSGIELTRDVELLVRSYLPQELSRHNVVVTGLELPLCIPQIGPAFSSPFARGYNALLGPAVGISQSELLQFIDGLNLALTASPPLRVVDVVGMGIGFVPYHWTIIAGAAMQAAAQTGMRILSKTMTDRYLRAANLHLFNPRGLSVRIFTAAGMMALLTSTEQADKSKSDKAKATLNKVGRGVGTVLLHLPLSVTSRVVRAIADPAPSISPSYESGPPSASSTPFLRRRMELVQGHALLLDLEVPPPAKPVGAMDTVNSWGVKFDQYQAGRKEKTNEQNRRKLAGDYGGSSSGRDRLEQRRDGLLARRGLRQGLLSQVLGPKETMAQRKVHNAELLDHWAADKVLWVVIMNSEKDEEISGIEIAESADNEEQIQDRDWQNIMTSEEEKLDHELEYEAARADNRH